MKTFGIILVAIVFVLTIIAINILIAYGAYALVLWAGAPRYIAVIVGLAVLAIGGVSSNHNIRIPRP